MESLIEKWRSRHAYPDAVGLWANATGPEARALAFNAIAQDPRVLLRAARHHAIRMAAQAEDFVQSLAGSPAAESEIWQAAIRLVLHAIEAWRRSPKAHGHAADGTASYTGPVVRSSDPADPWEFAQRNFPSVDNTTGQLATRLLHQFGSDVLRRARKPWDHVIVLAVLRYAARLLRGEVAERDPGQISNRAVADIVGLQKYCKSNLLSPLLVDYSGHGKAAAQALGLFRDARTLRDAMQATEAGGNAGWQNAMDFHAFAVVALDHRLLLDLPLDEAYALAAAALRLAEAALQAPESVQLPVLQADRASPPSVVAAHARACLPPEQRDQPQVTPRLGAPRASSE